MAFLVRSTNGFVSLLNTDGEEADKPAHSSTIIPDDAEGTKVSMTRSKRHCPTCGRAFSSSGHLTRHLTIHTGARRFECPFPSCDKRCSRHDNLTQHYRMHLSAELNKESSCVVRSLMDTMRSGRRPLHTDVTSVVQGCEAELGQLLEPSDRLSDGYTAHEPSTNVVEAFDSPMMPPTPPFSPEPLTATPDWLTPDVFMVFPSSERSPTLTDASSSSSLSASPSAEGRDGHKTQTSERSAEARPSIVCTTSGDNVLGLSGPQHQSWKKCLRLEPENGDVQGFSHKFRLSYARGGPD